MISSELDERIIQNQLQLKMYLLLTDVKEMHAMMMTCLWPYILAFLEEKMKWNLN